MTIVTRLHDQKMRLRNVCETFIKAFLQNRLKNAIIFHYPYKISVTKQATSVKSNRRPHTFFPFFSSFFKILTFLKVRTLLGVHHILAKQNSRRVA